MNQIPSTPEITFRASINPDIFPIGRSIWVMSPVITALLRYPIRVRNIFICSVVVFCASSRRSEEHTSELQSRGHLVCRLLLEKKKKKTSTYPHAKHKITTT